MDFGFWGVSHLRDFSRGYFFWIFLDFFRYPTFLVPPFFGPLPPPPHPEKIVGVVLQREKIRLSTLKHSKMVYPPGVYPIYTFIGWYFFQRFLVYCDFKGKTRSESGFTNSGRFNKHNIEGKPTQKVDLPTPVC